MTNTDKERYTTEVTTFIRPATIYIEKTFLSADVKRSIELLDKLQKGKCNPNATCFLVNLDIFLLLPI